MSFLGALGRYQKSAYDGSTEFVVEWSAAASVCSAADETVARLERELAARDAEIATLLAVVAEQSAGKFYLAAKAMLEPLTGTNLLGGIERLIESVESGEQTIQTVRADLKRTGENEHLQMRRAIKAEAERDAARAEVAGLRMSVEAEQAKNNGIVRVLGDVTEERENLTTERDAARAEAGKKHDEANRYLNEMADAKAELATLREDKARMDWLEEARTDCQGRILTRCFAPGKNTLRAAIDEARK